jgi:hypothetical protein
MVVESTKEGAKHIQSAANMRTSSLIPTKNYRQVIVRGKNICIPRVFWSRLHRAREQEAIYKLRCDIILMYKQQF